MSENLIRKMNCVVPENIHPTITAGIGDLLGEGRVVKRLGIPGVRSGGEKQSNYGGTINLFFFKQIAFKIKSEIDAVLCYHKPKRNKFTLLFENLQRKCYKLLIRTYSFVVFFKNLKRKEKFKVLNFPGDYGRTIRIGIPGGGGRGGGLSGCIK